MSRAHPIARPKRFAEQLEGSSTAGISAAISQSKKARTQFSLQNPSTLAADDDNDEDAILELDEIGRKGNQTKRNAVELDGYESDSSQENFDARADAKAKAGDAKGKGKKTKEEEANDMFADLEDDLADGDNDEDLAGEGKKRKKEVRFMEANEIEGQVANSRSGGHVSADFSLGQRGRDKDHESSSDEGDDEVRDMMDEDLDEELGAGAKKKHAPKLDAFNMRDEQEEGRFDENGNFVRKAADPFALHDAWLEGASKAEIKKAKDAEEKREEDRRRREREDDAISTGTLLGQLITRLQHGETSLEALARLASKTKEKKKKPKWQKNKKSNGSEMDVDTESAKDDPAETKRKEAVEAITAAADGLLTRGQPEIYDHERAVLMRQYKRETGEDWVDAVTPGGGNEATTKQWEYRWADERDGGEHHGPYDGPTMTSWNEAGYFGEGVVFRQVGTTDWSDSVDFH